MSKNILIRKLPNARIMKETPIHYDCGILERGKIFNDRSLTEPMCISGCKCRGINGGCPPYSPLFPKLFPGLDHMFAFYVSIEKETITEMLEMMSSYTMLRVLTKMLGYMCIRIGNRIDPSTRFLSSGTCKACLNGMNCNFGKGIMQCKKPGKRHFSLESTGIVVDSITWPLFGFQLDWYKSPYIPERLIQLGGILGTKLVCESYKEVGFPGAIKMEETDVCSKNRVSEQRVFAFTK